MNIVSTFLILRPTYWWIQWAFCLCALWADINNFFLCFVCKREEHHSSYDKWMHLGFKYWTFNKTKWIRCNLQLVFTFLYPGSCMTMSTSTKCFELILFFGKFGFSKNTGAHRQKIIWKEGNASICWILRKISCYLKIL